MKEIKLFQCEICHTQYSSQEACSECECFHNTRLKIKEKRYLGYKKNSDRFPIEIVVADASGQTAKYRSG